MSAGSDVAALAAQDILGEAAARGFSLNEDEAPETVSDESAAAEAPQMAAPEPPETQEEPEPLLDLSQFKPIGENEEDDEEDDFVLPPAAQVEEPDEDDGEEEWADPEVKRLRAQLKAQEKQLEHERKLRVESNRSKWQAKIESKYPLADFTSIKDATSRRAFERAAEASHNHHARVLAPHIAKLEAAQAALRAAGYDEGKTEAHKAWGKPTVGPQATTLSAGEYERGLEEVRKTGDLQKVIAYKRKFDRE